MELRITQECPQCGAPVEISESDHLLACPFCSTNNFLLSTGPFRYVLPRKQPAREPRELLYAPYLRFKGNIFFVTEKGITHRSVDTTQLGCAIARLPPSLGVRPQAMKLNRLAEQGGGRFLRLAFKASEILEKAAAIGELTMRAGREIYHRAFIGETLSFIYLPLLADQDLIVDGVTGSQLAAGQDYDALLQQGIPFQPRWRVSFLATLCPHCGWRLDGAGDCVVLTCTNCQSAWELTEQGLQQISWQIVPGDARTRLYLGFWRITAQIPALELHSFADFIIRTNQPLLPKPQWREQELSFWIPAFKLSPAIFLRAAKQMTSAQWRVSLMDGQNGKLATSNYPVTLSSSEARQSIKITLAAAASRKSIYALLPQVKLKQVKVGLVYVPFVDNHHEWLQAQTMTVIPKNVLEFGRSM